MAAASRVVAGDPFDPGVTMGPVITQAHKEKILGYIETGLKEGAK